MAVLVDSSAWIHWLRPDGDKTVAARVAGLLHSGDAAWCAMVSLELWNGAGGEQEKKILRDFTRVLPDLPITADVWSLSNALARAARAAGITVPATDLVIAACARHHGVGLEHADSDFDLLSTLTP